MQDQPEPRVSVGLTKKINLGNYESADASLYLSGLTASATEEQIEELLNVGRLAWSAMRQPLLDKLEAIRAGDKPNENGR